MAIPKMKGNLGVGYYSFTSHFVSENLNHLLGQILTIVDASIPESNQNKSIKDLIRDKFNGKQKWFSEVSWKNPEQIKEMDNWLGSVVAIPK